ncbi:hypothetical protein K6119_00645 [Paracrocinitomix mangrovi]|uniref:hypothetical protein n=1 Tax=Paracrocinitomix mangrovi TaxID=2862509 RepID=UPI001C8E1A72|nr:hypothetical protein [Paracrocinitomix mangrovi]UKN02023.1 hypothetical protein K6119_00645 [Paracrocinitomix mangrovi]
MNSLEIRTITPWKYYLFLGGTIPVWTLIPVFFVYAKGGSKNLAFVSAFLLLIVCVFLTHLLSRQWTIFTVQDGKISFNDKLLSTESIRGFNINKSGIGVTQFEFKNKSKVAINILLPNYGNHVAKLKDFLNFHCDNIAPSK